MAEFKPYYQRINTMPEHGEKFKEYLKLKAAYEELEKKFNDLHRRAKKLKQDKLLPAERKLRDAERELFKPKTIGT